MTHQPTPAATDADLARAWSAGDERGYDAIVTRYAPLVFSRCRRALGAADADDATQAVFLILARKREQAAASPALAAWLMAVAENVVRNAKRDRARRRRAESALPPPHPAAEETAMDDIKDHLDACLATLPRVEREAVMLHHLAGHSLAEVAGHVGAGLSTVKDRLNRGLGRLRTLLAKRGVALGAAALLACLQAEAQAAVPEGVMGHLRDLVPAGGRTGTTVAPSDRARLWSRNGLSTMTRLALVGSSLLLFGSVATCALMSADNQPPAPTAPPAVTPAPAATLDVDPEHARSWAVLRWNDGPRLAARLRKLPEMALLPPEGANWLAEVASLREAVVVADLQAAQSPEERARDFRHWRDIEKLPLAERMKRMQAELDKAVAETKAGKDPSTIRPNPWSIAGLTGWIAFADADAPALARLRSLLDGGGLGGIGAHRADGGWTLTSASGDLHLALAGSRLALQGKADDGLPALMAIAGKSTRPDADLELSVLLDPGLAGSALRGGGAAHLTVGDDGMHFSYVTPPVPADRAAEMAASSLDLKRLDAIPGSAFFSASMAKRPGDAFSDAFMFGMASSLSFLAASGDGNADESRAKVDAMIAAMRQIDGEIVAWIEPGAPLPMLTVEADLSRPAAEAMIAAFGQAPAADGSVSILAGPAVVSLGWRDGHLICTTNPGGLGAIDGSGGFTRQPEIRRALAAMPDRQPTVCVLMRPAALMAFIGPYVAMASPAWQQRADEYERHLEADTAYGFFTMGFGGGGSRIDAAGLLSLVAGAAMAGKMAGPGPMGIAN